MSHSSVLSTLRDGLSALRKFRIHQDLMTWSIAHASKDGSRFLRDHLKRHKDELVLSASHFGEGQAWSTHIHFEASEAAIDESELSSEIRLVLDRIGRLVRWFLVNGFADERTRDFSLLADNCNVAMWCRFLAASSWTDECPIPSCRRFWPISYERGEYPWRGSEIDQGFAGDDSISGLMAKGVVDGKAFPESLRQDRECYFTIEITEIGNTSRRFCEWLIEQVEQQIALPASDNTCDSGSALPCTKLHSELISLHGFIEDTLATLCEFVGEDGEPDLPTGSLFNDGYLGQGAREFDKQVLKSLEVLNSCRQLAIALPQFVNEHLPRRDAASFSWRTHLRQDIFTPLYEVLGFLYPSWLVARFSGMTKKRIEQNKERALRKLLQNSVNVHRMKAVLEQVLPGLNQYCGEIFGAGEQIAGLVIHPIEVRHLPQQVADKTEQIVEPASTNLRNPLDYKYDGNWLTANYCYSRFGLNKKSLYRWASTSCPCLKRPLRAEEFMTEKSNNICFHRLDIEEIVANRDKKNEK